jgi:hypothetical protein
VKARRPQRSLRWYPSAWRRRYGEELIALLEDTYGDGPLPLRCRMSLFRSGMIERGCEMYKKLHLGTYTAYSISCAIVWAVILTAVWAQASEPTRRTFALVCGGWAIGWLSATIARVVYPPPRRHKPAG